MQKIILLSMILLFSFCDSKKPDLYDKSNISIQVDSLQYERVKIPTH